MKNKTYKNKIDREWFKERDRVSKLFEKIDFHKIVYIFLLIFFVSSCSQSSKKNFITYGTGAGTGMATYTIVKSWLGKSGSGGNIPQVVAITTLGTLLGVFIGSEIGENLSDDEQQMINQSMESEEETTWTKVEDDNQMMAKVEPVEKTIIEDKDTKQSKLCKKFNWELEDSGQIRRGSGIACQNSDGDWQVLGDRMI